MADVEGMSESNKCEARLQAQPRRRAAPAM